MRGKKRTIEHVESFYLDQYDAKRRPNGEYELKVPYDTDEELDEAVNELLSDIACDAERPPLFLGERGPHGRIQPPLVMLAA